MTASLTLKDVSDVAALARLKLSDKELQELTPQLMSILEYMEILNEVDTEDVEPMAHAVEITNVLREDLPTPSLHVKAALSNAPKTDGQYFLVPPILGEN